MIDATLFRSGFQIVHLGITAGPTSKNPFSGVYVHL
jgi:hypothetical protein